MDVSKYKKLMRRAEKIQKHFGDANDAVHSDDLTHARKSLKKAKSLRKNPSQDYEENPFRARYSSGCPGCGQRIAEGEDAEYLNKFGNEKDPAKDKWIIHNKQSCYETALKVKAPECDKHGPMTLKIGQYGAYWQCSAKVGSGYCNAKPPRGQASWSSPSSVSGKTKKGGKAGPRTIIQSKHSSKTSCKACGEKIHEGENIVPWKNTDANVWVHENCFSVDILAKSNALCLVCREEIGQGESIVPWRKYQSIWTHEHCQDGEIVIEVPPKFRPDKFKASEHQLAIKEAYTKTKNHIIIDAKAGSGKTTTLEWLINTTYTHPPKQIVMMAFNRSIAKELNNRMRAIPGVEASTLNSYGYRLLIKAYGRPERVSGSKIKELAQRPGIGPDKKGFPFKKEDQARLGLSGDELKRKVIRNRMMAGLFQKTISKIKANLATPDQYEEIIERYKIPVAELSDEDHEIFMRTIPELLEADIKAVVDQELVDFDDQIWIPVVGAVKTAVPILPPNAKALLKQVSFPKDIDVLFVDESQDLNRCQQELALRTIGPNGRLIAVGDPFQSIYAFSGADSGSMKRLFSLLSETPKGCEVKDLSVTFRCPKAVVREAQRVLQTVIPAGVPVITPDQATIEPADYAPEGIVQTLPEDQVFDSLTIEKDAILRGEHVPTMILCRTNAPLLGAALRLISKGTPAKIVGRDVSKALLEYIDEINPKGNNSLEKFTATLEARLIKISELERELIERGELEEGDELSSPYQQEKDQVAAINIIALSPSLSAEGQNTVENLKKELDGLFNGGFCPKESFHKPDKYGRKTTYIADAGDTYCEVCLEERNEQVEIIKRQGVILSTVHKSKGLEALKIYILDPDRLGSPRPSASEEDQRQEIHLHYVAVTRTKFLKGDPDSGILTYIGEAIPSVAGAEQVVTTTTLLPPEPAIISGPPRTEEIEVEHTVPELPAQVHLPSPVLPPAPSRQLGFKFWVDADLTLPYIYPPGHKREGEQVVFPYNEQGRKRAEALLEVNKEDVASGSDVQIYCSPSPSEPIRELEPARLPSRSPIETGPIPSTSVKSVEEIRKMSLPKMAASGTGEFTEPTIADFQAIKALYIIKGIPAKIVKLPGWYQYALIVNGIACSSTTINIGSSVSRGIGKKALKVMQPDPNGRFIYREGPSIKRTAGWQGRVIERINEILLSRSPTAHEASSFEAMSEAAGPASRF